MNSPFLGFKSLSFFAFACMVLASNPANCQTRSDQAISSKESPASPIKKVDVTENDHDVNPATYSKNGSDSVSLIVFGRVLAPKVIAGKNNAATIAAPNAAKESKKKEKFSIKSSDKLKTNNSLY